MNNSEPPSRKGSDHLQAVALGGSALAALLFVLHVAGYITLDAPALAMFGFGVLVWLLPSIKKFKWGETEVELWEAIHLTEDKVDQVAEAIADPGEAGPVPTEAGPVRPEAGSVRSMEEFAAASGISPVTVSKYFRDPDSLRPSTRTRIEEALERFDYRPKGNLAMGGGHRPRPAVPAGLDDEQWRLLKAIQHPRYPLRTLSGIAGSLAKDPDFRTLGQEAETNGASLFPALMTLSGKGLVRLYKGQGGTLYGLTPKAKALLDGD